MTNSIDSVVISSINSVYGGLVTGQEGLVGESRSYVAEIRQAVLARLTPDAAAVIDAAIADPTNMDPAVDLLRNVVIAFGQEVEQAGRVQNYLGGISELIQDGRYSDAATVLGSAVDAAGQSALHAADVAQLRAFVLDTDAAHEDAQRAWGKIEAHARTVHAMGVLDDMLNPSLSESPATSP